MGAAFAIRIGSVSDLYLPCLVALNLDICLNFIVLRFVMMRSFDMFFELRSEFLPQGDRGSAFSSI